MRAKAAAAAAEAAAAAAAAVDADEASELGSDDGYIDYCILCDTVWRASWGNTFVVWHANWSMHCMTRDLGVCICHMARELGNALTNA